MRHAITTALTVVLLVGSAGCATDYHMGDTVGTAPVQQHQAAVVNGSPAVTPQASPPKLSSADRKRAKELAEWEAKWRQIQSQSDKVDWVEHFRVCTIKYRYRAYDDLFRCLDLLEAKVARGGKRLPHSDEAHSVTPVLAGWLRSVAYSELGQTDLALQWAQKAWSAVPPRYREASSRLTSHTLPLDKESKLFRSGAVRVGGSSSKGDNPDETEALWGRDNPAGLALSPEAITMSLAAQRSLLYQILGQPDKARSALAELRHWEDLRNWYFVIPIAEPRYWQRARLLSLGPLMAMGEYAEVVKVYEKIDSNLTISHNFEHVAKAFEWILFAPIMAVSTGLNTATDAMFHSDVRLFTYATEDVSNGLIYAQSLARLGKVDQARAMFDKLLALPEIKAMGNLYWVTLYELGRIAATDGKRAQAVAFLTQSVDAIESVRETISLEAAKIGFAGDKQAVYGALVTELAANGDWNGVFRTLERAKARALVDLLAQQRNLGAPAVANDKVRELFARAQTSEAAIGIPASAEAVRGIKLVADSRTALVSVAPEAASLISVQKVEPEEVRARMSPDETLIDYYASGDDLYALVLNDQTVQGFKLSAKGLDEDVRSFRESIEERRPDVAQRSHALYGRLIQPLSSHIAGNKLLIAPHGVLHYLPFAALQDGGGYLIDRFSVRLVPSAGALVYLKTSQPEKPGKLLALGNPDLGSARYDLPNAQAEAVNVAAMFANSRALVRAEASKSAVETLGNGFSMLHFATHGHFDANSPLSSGLYLAKGSAADGILTVSDLYTLRWDVDLVTLSACETGLGKVANGDDVIGLTRGFLYAGAGSIVASLWEVDDAATEHLMVSFYRNLEGHDKREALRLAQIETRKTYPDPRFWAAFQIVGRAD